MIDLDRLRVVHSGLTDRIMLVRLGEKGRVLDRREIEPDVVGSIIDHMMRDAPRGAQKEVEYKDGSYIIRVRPTHLAKQDDDILEAARNLVKVSGRHNSEIAMKRLIKAVKGEA